MNFLRKLLGHAKSKVPTPPSTLDPAEDPDMIRAFDAYGRQIFIRKQDWRDSVLLDHLRKVWEDPDALYTVIIQSLQDGFGAEVVEAAEHLAATDPNPQRGAVTLAIVYGDQGRPGEAERTLRTHIQQHGESGIVLTNLAKLIPDREEQLQTLWHALELDPNQENALGWYEATQREEGGPSAGLEALERIAALPGAWRARLWLGRTALQSERFPEARQLYEEALSLADRPISAELLMQMSGDLGMAGCLNEMLELVGPCFNHELHGLQVGNNLIRALLELGRPAEAHALVQQLFSHQRPDWKETLSYWDDEIAKARVAGASMDPTEEPRISMLSVEGPIWSPEGSPVRPLLPIPAPEAVQIAFLGSSVERSVPGQGARLETTDGPGRLSRALPLFLSEQIALRSQTATQTLVPWLNPPHASFVLSGSPWGDDAAVDFAKQLQPSAAYVVTTHLHTLAEPWRVDLRVLRTQDAQCLATDFAVFPSTQPQALLGLSSRLLESLRQQTLTLPREAPALYAVPEGPHLISYLVRLEQLLATRCSRMEGTPVSFLSGEHAILDGNLQLCLDHPENATTRLLLLQSCLSMKAIRPGIVSGYLERLEQLQREYPFPEPQNQVMQRLLEAIATPTQ